MLLLGAPAARGLGLLGLPEGAGQLLADALQGGGALLQAQLLDLLQGGGVVGQRLCPCRAGLGAGWPGTRRGRQGALLRRGVLAGAGGVCHCGAGILPEPAGFRWGSQDTQGAATSISGTVSSSRAGGREGCEPGAGRAAGAVLASASAASQAAATSAR